MNNTDIITTTLIIYHGPNCIDGFTAAWIAARYHEFQGIAYDLYPMTYGDEDWADFIEFLAKNKARYGRIVMVDFSMNADKCSYILDYSTVKNILILDHHKTAMEEYTSFKTFHQANYLDGQLCVIFDQDESGASLACKHYYSQVQDLITPWIIKYVKDYDLWQFIWEDDTKAINKLLQAQDKTIENWTFIAHSLETNRRAVLNEAYIHLREYNTQVKMYADPSKAQFCTIAGAQGLMTSCPPEYINDVGSELAKASGTYGLIYNEINNGELLKCSIRSIGDYDVEQIAQVFGGGGHKNAAGFKVSFDRLQEFALVQEINIVEAMDVVLGDLSDAFDEAEANIIDPTNLSDRVCNIKGELE